MANSRASLQPSSPLVVRFCWCKYFRWDTCRGKPPTLVVPGFKQGFSTLGECGDLTTFHHGPTCLFQKPHCTPEEMLKDLGTSRWLSPLSPAYLWWPQAPVHTDTRAQRVRPGEALSPGLQPRFPSWPCLSPHLTHTHQVSVWWPWCAFGHPWWPQGKLSLRQIIYLFGGWWDICCFIYWRIHWLPPVCTLTREQTHNLGVLDNALSSCATRPGPTHIFNALVFLSVKWRQQFLLHACREHHTVPGTEQTFSRVAASILLLIANCLTKEGFID